MGSRRELPVYRRPGPAAFATSTAGVVFTIPSLALLGLLISVSIRRQLLGAHPEIDWMRAQGFLG